MATSRSNFRAQFSGGKCCSRQGSRLEDPLMLTCEIAGSLEIGLILCAIFNTFNHLAPTQTETRVDLLRPKACESPLL
jgi:hypothetical protein